MKRFVLLLPFVLASCGTLPEPFYGDPGVQGAKLATPPPPVLVVPIPDNALLVYSVAKVYSDDLTAALANVDVPSVARWEPGKSDWLLTITANLKGTQVVPRYAIVGPDGKSYGSPEGAPVPASDWANGDPAALNEAATTDALMLSKFLASVNATVQQSNPESLENRPARVFMGAVTGAPGDGDNALSLNITRDLPGLNIAVTNNQADADFIITGVVTTQPDTNNQILVQINWIIHDSNNREIGQVTQLHDLKPTDITPYWGDVAAAAASQGASGIQEAITNAKLHKKTG